MQKSHKILHNSDSPKLNVIDLEKEKIIGKEFKNQMVNMFEEIKKESNKQMNKMFNELIENAISKKR